jgi:hypothetical protein
MLEDTQPPLPHPLSPLKYKLKCPKKLSSFDDVFSKNQGICDRIFRL